MRLETLQNLYVSELQDLYSAETQLIDALPRMVAAARHDNLKKGLQDHLIQTHDHVHRLEKIFDELEITPGQETCEAMQGLIQEGEETLNAYGDPDVKDAALIAAAQRIEHYEIAVYGTARTFARHLGFDEHAKTLQQTLNEEGAADHHLTKLAEGDWFSSGLNKEAAQK